MTQHLIGISGLNDSGTTKHSGKDTVANVLCDEFAFTRISFSDPLKVACAEWFGWTLESLYTGDKEAIDPYWGISRRHAMQQLGTEYGRAMHPDLWVRYAIRRFNEQCNLAGANRRRFVIPDVRFQNEIDAILAAGGSVVRVYRAGYSDPDEHASELSSDLQGISHVIYNDSSLKTLILRARRLGVQLTK